MKFYFWGENCCEILHVDKLKRKWLVEHSVFCVEKVELWFSIKKELVLIFIAPWIKIIFSLESDQMTALWENDILNLTFYVAISNSIAKFCKRNFLIWYLVQKGTKWLLCDEITVKLSHFKYHTKPNNFCKISFLIRCLVSKVTKWLLNFYFSLDILK